jgi:hypothetical protein
MIINEEWLQDHDKQLEIVLDVVCEKLQLPKTLKAKVDTSYQTIVQLIEEDDEFFKGLEPHMFPYGSYAIDTTNKPWDREEFDLDFAIFVIFNKSEITTKGFLQKLYNLLERHGTYKDKIELLRFCVRIQYEGFHLDIMPGCYPEYDNLKMEVPDTKKIQWAYRNLKGYADWFKGGFILNEREIKLFSYYEKRGYYTINASSEPLPQSVPYEVVQPLQKAVQLIKRARDIYFQRNNLGEYKTRSVVLTTLVGQFYNGENNIYETLNNVIQNIYELSEQFTSSTPIDIYNPADKRENFSDKWKEPGKERLYKEFLNFAKYLKDKWEELKDESTKKGRSELLKDLFGKSVAKEILLTDNLWSNRQNVQPRMNMPNYIPHSKNLAEVAPEKPWRYDESQL